ncbi:hypothetical protein [Streptomyces sp. Isolate_219]|uniref:hypothetical protein n=1 Tax=Streptomyces sp. Isolate_219 TaxID=2950110 RepID=UPI0021C6406F|nr:hypothetical protein [Streptomyces sp. Isolate_219]MCR8576446.1 hypothetical protein [Streptomyces sp. Isolate_219]
MDGRTVEQMVRDEFLATLPIAHDDFVRQPLWLFDPAERPAVIAERRRRFGIADEEIGDPEYS